MTRDGLGSLRPLEQIVLQDLRKQPVAPPVTPHTENFHQQLEDTLTAADGADIPGPAALLQAIESKARLWAKVAQSMRSGGPNGAAKTAGCELITAIRNALRSDVRADEIRPRLLAHMSEGSASHYLEQATVSS